MAVASGGLRPHDWYRNGGVVVPYFSGMVCESNGPESRRRAVVPKSCALFSWANLGRLHTWLCVELDRADMGDADVYRLALI